MATPPRLTVSGLPSVSQADDRATQSPARGAEMRNFLQARLQKNRAPPLVHSWDFWHDRQDRSPANLTNGTNDASTLPNAYEERLVRLAEVNDVRSFWAVFNNFDTAMLPLRDSVHLFHKGIKPIWEDPRNEKGGSWTFRVPKSQAPEFWKEVCMMAIGEQLQAAVDSDRKTFRDDICGISLGVRFNSMLVQIWNRDGSHEAGIQNILTTILSNLSADFAPREGSYYYKKHSEHSGFSGNAAAPIVAPTNPNAAPFTPSNNTTAHPTSSQAGQPGDLPKGAAAINPQVSQQIQHDAPGVTRSSQPALCTTFDDEMSEDAKNDDAVEDMRYAIDDMSQAMGNVGKP